MKGYVKNKSNTWRHALKRSIGPGAKVPLDELYEQYGKKHDLPANEEFVDWLRNIKLRDSNIWEIVFEDGDRTKDVPIGNVDVKAIKEGDDLTSPFVKKELDVKDIVYMPVRKARQELSKITDIKLLKYAYREANQLAHKETLCKLLRKRIQELELTRR